MTKLEEHIIAIMEEYGYKLERGDGDDHRFAAFENGIRTAIALDLPVKFAAWSKGNIGHAKNIVRDIVWQNPNTDYKELAQKIEEALYKYWIENVFKIE